MSAPLPAAESRLDTRYAAETPEGIALWLRPAGVVPRFYAYLVDARDPVLLPRRLVSLPRPCSVLFGEGLALVLLFLLEWLYPVAFELSAGAATPGKRMLGLTVVMDSGLPITPAASLTRNLLRAADFLPSLYAFGLLSMLFRHDFKRLGDLAAGTLVVHARARVPARHAARRRRRGRRRCRCAARAQAAIVAWAGRVHAPHRGARRRARGDRRAGGRAARRWAAIASPRSSASRTGCSAGDDAAAVRGAARRRLAGARQPRSRRTLRASADRRRADRARVAALYRAACEHLAIAESRVVSGLADRAPRGADRARRTSSSTASADFGIDRLRRLFLSTSRARCARIAYSADRRRGVRRAAARLGVLAYLDPGLILSLHDAGHGRAVRKACTATRRPDRPCATPTPTGRMFGFYIRNNIGVAFQCFAGGLFLGLGSLFFLAFNGAVGRHRRRLPDRRAASATTFYSVRRHARRVRADRRSSSPARPGSRLGHALLAPGPAHAAAGARAGGPAAHVLDLRRDRDAARRRRARGVLVLGALGPAAGQDTASAGVLARRLAYLVFQGRPRAARRGAR